MIDGVKIRELASHVDERGYFREVLRDDENFISCFGQVSLSLTKPGVIKAFHWHNLQDDVFYAVSGESQVVLYDRRENSNTFKELMTFKMSGNDPKILFIPRGVAHGYKAMGKIDLIMLYIMTKSYNKNSPDELRIPFDDKTINFNWNKY
jgi:dTDP-4-dehydrorhamnose 3,5-epimerase